MNSFRVLLRSGYPRGHTARRRRAHLGRHHPALASGGPHQAVALPPLAAPHRPALPGTGHPDPDPLRARPGAGREGPPPHLRGREDVDPRPGGRAGAGRRRGPGRPLHLPDRYQRRGAVQLFGGLLVHTGESLARCLERKRFVEFQSFLRRLFGSGWCRPIRSLHLILDNGSSHAPERPPAWIRTLDLPFPVHLHWLPVNAS
jgi:hypothetical protein